MSTFIKKNLEPPKRVCVHLKELREAKGVSLADLAKKTKIDQKHLNALENCQFNFLPEGDVYQKNILKKYLLSLGVDPKILLDRFVNEELVNPIHNYKQNENTYLSSKINWSNLPQILRYAGLAILVLIFIGYLGFQVKRIIDPPFLALYSPQDGKITNESFVMVQGQTEKEIKITINGKEVANNDKSQFSERLDLIPGLNSIEVTAEKKHGKTTTITRYVVLSSKAKH
jgi:cytoskeletal protein RodZ